MKLVNPDTLAAALETYRGDPLIAEVLKAIAAIPPDPRLAALLAAAQTLADMTNDYDMNGKGQLAMASLRNALAAFEEKA